MKRLLIFLGLVFSGAIVISACAASNAAERLSEEGEQLAVATFAGGCFWCVESDFEKVPGVVEVTSGYTGGSVPNPSYERVSSGATGHREAVRVRYDPALISYEGLLQAFWRMIDPTDGGGQFGDRGEQYTTAIWYHTEQQRKAAEKSKAALNASDRYAKPLVTEILSAEPFYEAEDYHQDYYRLNSLRYRFYRRFSGRDQYLESVWGADLDLDFDRFRPAAG